MHRRRCEIVISILEPSGDLMFGMCFRISSEFCHSCYWLKQLQVFLVGAVMSLPQISEKKEKTIFESSSFSDLQEIAKIALFLTAIENQKPS